MSTGHGAVVMLCGWEDNRRSGVATRSSIASQTRCSVSNVVYL